MAYTRTKKPILQQVASEPFASQNLLFDDQHIYINGVIVAGLSPQTIVNSGSTYTVSSSDYYVIVRKTVGSATTINIPAAGNAGLEYTIKDGKGDAATHNITITPASGTIDGASTFVMNINWQSNTILDDGTTWNVI
jgi:hypothetical protein